MQTRMLAAIAALLATSAFAATQRPLYEPSLSPDGKSLAFVSNRTGNGDIDVLDLTTGEACRLTREERRNE